MGKFMIKICLQPVFLKYSPREKFQEFKRNVLFKKELSITKLDQIKENYIFCNFTIFLGNSGFNVLQKV